MDPDASSTARIPYDILTSIIDELALQGRVKELRACSQTCRMLLHPCRVHLFSTVVIHGYNTPQFAILLNRNPTLQVYIRKLSYKPAVLTEDIANAFLLLSNLKTLDLQGYRYGTRATLSCEWWSLTPHLQHALIHLFSSPSITRIVLDSFSDVPIILLSSCSNLKHLAIDYYTSFTSNFCDTTLVEAPPKLISLKAATLKPTVESLLNERRVDGLPMLDLSCLQSLNISVIHGPAEEKHLAQVLRSTPKLEHLYLTVLWEALISDSLAQTLTILWPSLRSLQIFWAINDVEVSNKFPGLIKAVEALGYHPNCINEISLIFWTPWSQTFADQDWERIDQVLADRITFRRLEKLRIEFWTKLEGLADRMEDQFLRFRVTKLLRLSQLSSHLHQSINRCETYLDFRFSLDDDDEPR